MKRLNGKPTVQIAHLNKLAVEQTNMSNVRVINEAADKASNTYRRQMLALAEYRKPPRVGGQYTAIQQIVQNGAASAEAEKNVTNEKGLDGSEPQKTPKAEPEIKLDPRFTLNLSDGTMAVPTDQSGRT